MDVSHLSHGNKMRWARTQIQVTDAIAIIDIEIV